MRQMPSRIRNTGRWAVIASVLSAAAIPIAMGEPAWAQQGGAKQPKTVVKPARDSESGQGAQRGSRGGFPAHWWAPVPEAQKASWEVLPQAAKPGEVVLSKRHELGVLSNFAATPFTLRGKRYPGVEGFWQMMLYPEGPDDPRARFAGITWPRTREEVAQMTAFAAKAAGTLGEENMKKMGIDWVTFEGKRIKYWSKEKGEHYRLIVEAMRAKLEQNPQVEEILLSTGDLVLLPDHIQEEDPPAEWQYFKIWMELRSELQEKERQRRLAESKK
jgi:predicted NAD-dependent protein-ADP-ribosyltransferase YbiA (DUF1768 family)